MSSNDVAIVGIGMHPFGRTPDLSGRAQGAHAARAALRDAGVEWKDMQFAFGGSYSAGDADSLVNELGLTGLPFINVSNGCGTGGSALTSARGMIGRANTTWGSSSASTSIRPGRSTKTRRLWVWVTGTARQA